MQRSSGKGFNGEVFSFVNMETSLCSLEISVTKTIFDERSQKEDLMKLPMKKKKKALMELQVLLRYLKETFSVY